MLFASVCRRELWKELPLRSSGASVLAGFLREQGGSEAAEERCRNSLFFEREAVTGVPRPAGAGVRKRRRANVSKDWAVEARRHEDARGLQGARCPEDAGRVRQDVPFLRIRGGGCRSSPFREREGVAGAFRPAGVGMPLIGSPSSFRHWVAGAFRLVKVGMPAVAQGAARKGALG